LISGEEKSNTQ